MSPWRVFTTCLYLGFIAVVSWACFRHPVADDFDRYIYEALVRGKYETVEVVYPVIKHSNKRAEESSILDSPTHLGQLEPLYAIKPLYVKAIEATSFTRLPIPGRINLISALSLFGVGIVVLGWTGKPGYSALLLATSATVVLGRMGTPDGLSALVVISGLWAFSRNKLLIGVLLLLVSIWIRTDNFLLVIAVLAYLLWQKRMTLVDATAISALSAGSVAFINHFSGNYSWLVLFQFSFIGGRSPAEIDPRFSAAQYLGGVRCPKCRDDYSPSSYLGFAWRSGVEVVFAISRMVDPRVDRRSGSLLVLPLSRITILSLGFCRHWRNLRMRRTAPTGARLRRATKGMYGVRGGHPTMKPEARWHSRAVWMQHAEGVCVN